MLTRLFKLPMTGFIDTIPSAVENLVLYLPSEGRVGGECMLWEIEIKVDGFDVYTYEKWQRDVYEVCRSVPTAITTVDGWPEEVQVRHFSNVKNFLLMSRKSINVLKELTDLTPCVNHSSVTKRALYELRAVMRGSGHISDGTTIESVRRYYQQWSPMFSIVKVRPYHDFRYLKLNAGKQVFNPTE